MKKIGYLIITIIFLLLCLTGLSLAGAESAAGLKQDVLVLFTSDVHCGVNQNFTYAGLQAVKDAAGEAGNHVLLVDDGDSVQGEPIGILSAGMERIIAVAEAPAAALPELPEGVLPVTWDVSADHLMIETEEARELYERIVAEDYPSMEELRAHPVVAQLDALSAYYKALYGNTADIDTPERSQLRQEVMEWFLSLGSARTESIDENGKHHYVYDGPLNREYKMELVLGLPASGKSTMIVDPDSEEMGAFVLDPDVIKAELPEYKESHGAAADSIHFEGMMIFNNSLDAFLTGDLQGVNVVLPIVGTDLNELLETYIRPFEAAGYHVKVKFREAKTNEAAARVVMRELAGGQLINSRVAFDFGAGVEDVYLQLAEMTGPDGEPYVDSADEELAPAA